MVHLKNLQSSFFKIPSVDKTLVINNAVMYEGFLKVFGVFGHIRCAQVKFACNGENWVFEAHDSSLECGPMWMKVGILSPLIGKWMLDMSLVFTMFGIGLRNEKLRKLL